MYTTEELLPGSTVTIGSNVLPQGVPGNTYLLRETESLLSIYVGRWQGARNLLWLLLTEYRLTATDDEWRQAEIDQFLLNYTPSRKDKPTHFYPDRHWGRRH